MFGHVTEPVGLPAAHRRAEDLGRSGDIEQVDLGQQDEDDVAHPVDDPCSAASSATIAMRANRSRRATSVRSMIS